MVKKMERPWYISSNAYVLPKRGYGKIWPYQTYGDRIVEQLMFIPEKVPNKTKTVFVHSNYYAWDIIGEPVFAYCPVNKCNITTNLDEAENADAILFNRHTVYDIVPSIKKRQPTQVWIFHMLESPDNTMSGFLLSNSFNWTATYRSDSDIVIPYGKWVNYDPKIRQKKQEKNYAQNKTRLVAWFVSNCGTLNERDKYARKLQKYINVDIYGKCGTKQCPRNSSAECFKMLKEKYKFYLSFENSNCKEYITEKFYINGLENDILPIVMGARPEDYKKYAPENSYIHVEDFKSPKDLAIYLHELDRNDDMYNEYFKWKGTGEIIKTHFFCRLCALLHDDFRRKTYKSMNKWWVEKYECTGPVV